MKRSTHALTSTQARTASQKTQRNGSARLACIKLNKSGSQNGSKFAAQAPCLCQHLRGRVERNARRILARLVVLVRALGGAYQHTCAHIARNVHGIPRHARRLASARTRARCNIGSNVNNKRQARLALVSEHSLINAKIKTGHIIARHTRKRTRAQAHTGTHRGYK